MRQVGDVDAVGELTRRQGDTRRAVFCGGVKYARPTNVVRVLFERITTTGGIELDDVEDIVFRRGENPLVRGIDRNVFRHIVLERKGRIKGV